MSFRGFTASPLLGTPQGLAVYVDGVRVNEPFGDVVNWDLIPDNAIQSIDPVPGSNPVFGLNSLGGALAITTKSGFDDPGIDASGYTGSFYRRAAETQLGANTGKVGYFLAGNVLNEDGWRDHSPSRLRQLLMRTDLRPDSTTRLSLSYTGAHNNLSGTQALPREWLDSPQEPYTWPDSTENYLNSVNLQGRSLLGTNWLISGNLYWRQLRSRTVDSNVNNDFDPSAPIGTDNAPGENERSEIHTNGYGSALQLTSLVRVFEHDNQLSVGATVDIADTDFSQYSQPAQFVDTRKDEGFAPFKQETRLDAKNHYYGMYFTDTFTILSRLDLTLSGRYNIARVELKDRLGTALSGDHHFSRFNPAVGLTFRPLTTLTTYVSYSEGTRMPTPVEFTCASPTALCKLPNEFLADPPLDQVVARTWSLGARGRIGGTWHWAAALYRTDVDNDILFVSTSAVNAGFFKNVPSTRRQGVELGIQGRAGPFTVTGSYTFTDATYQAGFTELSPNNSSADANGDIQVHSGDRIPGIPRHTAKLDNLFARDYQTLGVLGENDFTVQGRSFDAANATPSQFRSPGAPRGIWTGLQATY